MTPFQKKQLDLMRQMEYALAADTRASTIVPMQSDYTNDTQLALTCISQVPKEIAATIQTKIIQPLRELEPDFFYYPDDALHITIQNIRVIHDPPRFSTSDVAQAQTVLATLIPKTAPFPFVYAGLLSMPTSVSLIALVSPGYDRFVRRLRTSLINANVPDDKKYFTDEIIFANTTICRYTHKPSEKFTDLLIKNRDIRLGQFTPRAVRLMSMNAVAGPAKTTILGEYQFARI